MATTDKKKPEPPVLDPAVAGLPSGVLAGMAALQQSGTAAPTAPKLFHSPVQPNAATVNAPAPVAPAAPATAFGAGAATRDVVGSGVATLVNTSKVKAGLGNLATHAVQDAVTAPVEGFARGLLGMQPAAPPTATPPAASPTLARTPAAPAAFGNVKATASTMPAAPAQGAVVAAPAPATAAVPTLRPGDVNTFTGHTGVTRAVPGMTTAPGGVGVVGGGPIAVASAPVVPASIDAPQTRAPQVTLNRTLSGDLSGAERERQALLSDLSSQEFRASMGRPSRGQRATLAQLRDQRLALTQGRIAQQTGLETRGAEMDANASTENARLQSQTGEANANRKQRAGEFNTSTGLERDRLEAGKQEVDRTLTGDDGTTSLLRRDGSMTPITGADGKPFRELNKTGSITDSDLFSAYSKEASTINDNTLLKPEERSAMLAALQQRPEYQGVLQKVGAVKGAGAAPPDAVAFLKANPDKAADFDAKFGKGASTRYLSP
jgi:hypothetical protein